MKEISILQEKSIWGDQVSLIPNLDNRKQASCVDEDNKIILLKKADCNWVTLVQVCDKV